MKKRSFLLSVIILTYKSENTIDECLASLARAISGITTEVIVVDNASPDATLTRVEKYSKRFPRYTIIPQAQNGGFSKGVNVGLKKAKGDYVLLLNPDAKVSSRLLAQLLEDIRTEESVGVVGPLFRYPQGDAHASAGNFPSFYGEFLQLFRVVLFSKGRLIDPLSAASKPQKMHVDWISGGCMLIKRAVIDSVGYFDERYFMYLEDIDYCLRARTHGWDVLWDTRVSVSHHLMASSQGARVMANIYEARALLAYCRKNMNIAGIWLWVFACLLQLKLLVKLLCAKKSQYANSTMFELVREISRL